MPARVRQSSQAFSETGRVLKNRKSNSFLAPACSDVRRVRWYGGTENPPGGKNEGVVDLSDCIGFAFTFAIGHTLGFRQTPPEWGVDQLVNSMRTIHFDAQGFNRTYYDFYVGFGLFVSILLLFAAVAAWQLGGMSREALARIPGITWSLAICFVVVTALSWRYFFLVPVVFSGLISCCLLLAAWLSTKPA
jgi:hypothetical protein